MKTIFEYSRFILAAVLLVVLASCQKNMPVEPAESGPVIKFTAVAESPANKGFFTDNGAYVTYHWRSTDMIDLYDRARTKRWPVKSTGREGDIFVDFEWSEPEDMTDSNKWPTTAPDPAELEFAAHPHRAIDEYTDAAGTEASFIKYSQSYGDYVSNSILAPMLAVMPKDFTVKENVYDFGKVDFWHIGGCIKLELVNMPAGVTRVDFTALDDVKINGIAKIVRGLTEQKIIDGTWLDGWIEGETVRTNRCVVNLKTTTVAGGAETIYIPIPAGTTFTTKGFRVDLKNSSGEIVGTRTYPFKNGYTMQRARVLKGIKLDYENIPVKVNVNLNSTHTGTDLTNYQFYAYRPTELTMFPVTEPRNSKKASSVTKTTSGSNAQRYLAQKDGKQFSLEVFPSDYKDKDFYLVVEMTRDGANGDGHKVYIPIKYSAADYKSQMVSAGTIDIDLQNITAANANCEWFAADEPRYIPKDLVAYGEANTYFIQCKNGQTYNGATYAANAYVPDEVVIDYRARGDFFKAEIPEGVTFDWFRLSNGNIYTPRTTQYGNSGIVIDEDCFRITHDAANYRVKVKNTGAYAGAPILLMKKGGKVLWAWSFWNIAADGTSIDAISVGGKNWAPMDIGQATTQWTTWTANKNTAAGKTDLPDPIYRMTHLYQWGRYTPVFWTSYWTVDGDIFNQTGRQIPGLAGPVTFAESLENPVGFIMNTASTELADWCSEARDDLWHYKNFELPTAEDRKAVYDPCPKGWMVPDETDLDLLVENQIRYGGSTGYYNWVMHGGLVLPLQGYITSAAAGTDYRLESQGLGENGNPSNGVLWACNRLSTDNTHVGTVLSSSGSAPFFKASNQLPSRAAPVRCIKEE